MAKIYDISARITNELPTMKISDDLIVTVNNRKKNFKYEWNMGNYMITLFIMFDHICCAWQWKYRIEKDSKNTEKN